MVLGNGGPLYANRAAYGSGGDLFTFCDLAGAVSFLLGALPIAEWNGFLIDFELCSVEETQDEEEEGGVDATALS